MAHDEERLTTDEKIERRLGRTIANWTVILGSLFVLGAWVVNGGWYTLEPGEGAVVLRVGRYDRTVVTPGPHLRWPPPIEQVSIVEVGTIREESFGIGGRTDTEAGGTASSDEDVIQTADSNIVNIAYQVQYSVGDAYAFRFGMVQPDLMLRDATQAAVRAVVGSRTVDEVLNNREQIMVDARLVLIETLDNYFAQIGRESAFEVLALNLLNVQPPAEVRQAFDDVAAARQDLDRSLSEARGDAQEILQRANALAVELRESAEAYKQERILESRGEAARFESLLVEYLRAPEVTRERLYLETMEEILPDVNKILIEPETAMMLPFYPMGGAAGAVPAPAPGGRATQPDRTADEPTDRKEER